MTNRDTDRLLLEKAAKAIGLPEADEFHPQAGLVWVRRDPSGRHENRWNPLTDDGDALRLAVKLSIYVGEGSAEAWRNGRQVAEIFEDGTDPYAATRRAIVRAAAALGDTPGAS